MKTLIFLSLLVWLSGCAWGAYSNKKSDESIKPISRASFNIEQDRGDDLALVILSLSGGGSRAAILAAKVMLKLQQVYKDIDLLQEVDVISSVSGGSLTAAYYCLSMNPDDFRIVRVFSEPSFENLSKELKDLKTIGELDYDTSKKLLKFKGKMSEKQRTDLSNCFPNDLRSQKKVYLLYQLSQKKVKSRRRWDEKRVEKVIKKNYTARWVGNWFWPHNILLYWTTAYNRSNIMARTFADNLYDVGYDWDNIITPWRYGDDLDFKDLNQERPYLVINSTDNTEPLDSQSSENIFTFTSENFFEELKSDINEYPIAHAVVASAAFPAVFNYVTIKNYNEGDKKEYRHVFDGGCADNLGLTSARKIIEINRNKFKKFVVILVDAYTKPKGTDRTLPDPRSSFIIDRLVDTNFLDAFNSLLSANREEKVNGLKDWLEEEFPDTSAFFHIKFDSLEDEHQNLKRKLDKIGTNFAISDEDVKIIDQAVDILVQKENKDLEKIHNLLILTK